MLLCLRSSRTKQHIQYSKYETGYTIIICDNFDNYNFM